eukprot:COSAG04_NODE_271_length_18505_cov_15.097957_10_plen_333_part_00
MDDDVARQPEEPEPQPPPQPPRLLLCGSDVPDHDVLLSAAQPWVSVFMVDVGRSLGETAQKLRWYSERAAADKSATAANEPFASAALVLVEPHRVEGTIRVTSCRGGEIDERTVERPEVVGFFAALAALLAEPPRIHVVGCDFNASRKDAALVKQLASVHGVDVVGAASLAEVGRRSKADDVEMARSPELTDHRTEENPYFRASQLAEWTGSLEKPTLLGRHLAWPSLELSPHPGRRWLRRAHWLVRAAALLAASVGIVAVLARTGLRVVGTDGRAVGAVALSLTAYLYLPYLLWMVWVIGVFVLAFLMWLCEPLCELLCAAIGYLRNAPPL